MSEYLFIGGGQDGKKLFVHETQDVIRCVIEREFVVEAVPSPIVPPMKFEHYHREVFRTPTKDFILFRHEGLTLERMFERLLDGYNKQSS